MEKIKLQCPAKINLALSVGAPREDGYHPIVSWMVAVDLYDELTLSKAQAPSFEMTWAGDAPRPAPIDWPIEKDLMYRAWELVQQELGRELPIQLNLLKRIPAGAGLAGGSSNAVFTILGLNQLFELGMSQQTMLGIANQLGSDLSFFFAMPSAILSGRGDHVVAREYDCPLTMVLIFPDFGCPTGRVYQTFDLDCGEVEVNEEAVLDLLELKPLPPNAPFNDLAGSALTVAPALAEIRQDLSMLWQKTVHVTGSGSTMFSLWPDEESADSAIAQVSCEELGVQLIRVNYHPDCG